MNQTQNNEYLRRMVRDCFVNCDDFNGKELSLVQEELKGLILLSIKHLQYPKDLSENEKRYRFVEEMKIFSKLPKLNESSKEMLQLLFFLMDGEHLGEDFDSGALLGVLLFIVYKEWENISSNPYTYRFIGDVVDMCDGFNAPSDTDVQFVEKFKSKTEEMRLSQ